MSEMPRLGKVPGSENARSLLMDTLRALPLDEHFSRASLKSAEALVLLKHAWREPLGWYRPPGSNADALQCEFVEADGIWRLVEIYLYRLFGEVRLESKCGCGQVLCPHAAAMVVRLRRLLDWPRALTPLERWRRRLDTVMEPARAKPRPPQERGRDVICLLHADARSEPAQLFARLMLAHLERGSITEMTPLEGALAGGVLDSRFMMWQARLETGRASEFSKRLGYRLEGSGGAALLDELVKGEMCFHAHTLQRIYEAPARDPPWRWSRDALAQSHLTLDWGEHDVKVIDVHHLRYFDETTGELGLLKLSPRAHAMVVRMPPIPPGEKDAPSEWPPHPALYGIPAPPAAPVLRGIREPLQAVLVIGASRDLETDEFVFCARVWADYAGCRLPLAGESWQQSTVQARGREYVCIHRDIEREVKASCQLTLTELVSVRRVVPDITRLSPVPAIDALAHRQYFRGGTEVFAALVGSLTGLEAFSIEYDPELPFSVLKPNTPLVSRFAERESAGWTQFELAATVDGGEINVLPIVLDGFKRKAFSLTPGPNEPLGAHWLVPLTPERFLPLPLAQLREWFGVLSHCQQSTKEGISLTRPQAIALGERLEEHGVSLQGAMGSRVSETLAVLRAAQRSTMLDDPPPIFRGVLRTYQRDGLRWLQTLRQSELGGILADDMGLGKTVQVIAHLTCELQGGRLANPALIVVPTSLVFNWLDEFARFAPDLRPINFTGPDRASRREQLRDAHVVIVSYALLGTELETLEKIEYSMLVLDEAQWIKNPSTQTARAVRVLNARHRLVVSGTPLENHLGELWAHMDAVMPGYLGDARSFRRSFRLPIEREADDARMILLRQRLAPFLLRRTKAQVEPELPEKTETVHRVAMGEGQRRLYESLRLALSEQVRKAITSYNEEQSRIVVLSALLRLRQVCCDPRLLEASSAEQSAKLDALLELIVSLRKEGWQILVFSQFTTMLDLIARELTDRGLAHTSLTGSTPDRRTPVERFQSGTVKILLASLKAGGVGLNLTAADAVIHYDPWWNPAVERQAEDRAHRIGRQRPVFVYKLICNDTIEEKIESMKSRKSELAGALLGGDCSPSLFSLSEMRLLFDWAASPE